MISRARGLAQNTRGNPGKYREGKRITNTEQDRLITVSLSNPQNSRIKEAAGGAVISTLLTGDCKNRRAQPRMRFYQKFSLYQIRSSAGISQHNGASHTHKTPKSPQIIHSFHTLPHLRLMNSSNAFQNLCFPSNFIMKVHWCHSDAPCTLSILRLLFSTA